MAIQLKSSKFLFPLSLFLIVFGAFSLLLIHNNSVYSRSQTVTVDACKDPSALNHVWIQSRLYAQKQCAQVRGTVEDIGLSDDGDVDILLREDLAGAIIANTVNLQKEKGDLVVEIVCEGKVTNIFALGACGSYHNQIPLPKKGDHIQVVGAQVLDLLHGGWEEIHPIYQITPL